VVEPTLTALDIHAGAPIRLVNPPLPAEAIVAIPNDLRLSIAAFVLGLAASQEAADEYAPPPRLKFTEDMSMLYGGPARVATLSKPFIKSEV